MSFSMSSRDTRAVVILGTALIAFFAWGPIRSGYAELRDGIEMNRESLATELSLLENATRYPDLYRQADSSYRVIVPRVFMQQDNDLATVALQQYVDNIARSSSVLVTQTRNQPAARYPNGLRSLHIDIQAESDLEGILKFLNGLESGGRVIQVRSLDMQPGSSESGIEANENALKLSASIVGFAIDTAVVRGHVAPPRPEARGRRTQ